ncbi:MAG: methyltransferase domain-containing protein [Anaerolineae bacterium]|nr:methyltransferase domain-containing protein [Anaerolineae bacterium]
MTNLSTEHSPRVRDDVVRQHVPCNLCGSHDRQPYCPENGLGLVQCNHCGFVYVSPRPDAKELYALYGETYFHNNESGVVGYTDYIKDEPNIRRTAQRRLTHLEQYVSPGKLLDVGCATGFFLDEARKRGWSAEGLDVSSFGVQYAQEHFGLTTYHGSLTDLDFESASYDLVTMWDVIEHVPDPTTYVRRAAELVRSGGFISLATPDIDSLPARLAGRRWVGFKLSEEHVYYFSVKTLTKMLNEAGFEVVNVRHIGKYVPLSLFRDRLGFYFPWLAKALEVGEKALGLSEWALYINPYDIVQITAWKR